MTGIIWLAPMTPIAVLARYENAQAQHLMLAYGIERSPHIVGLSVTIAVINEAYDGEVQALRAILPSWLPCQNQNPHITISWVDGSAPVKSNLMLEGEHREEPFEAIVHCMVEFVEWGSKPSQKKTWRDRPLQQCQHIWKTGKLAGQQCSELTRRSPRYCTKHRP